MIEDDVSTPLSRIFGDHFSQKWGDSPASHNAVIPTTISKVWFSGAYSQDAYILAGDDWKVKILIPRLSSSARPDIAKLVINVEIIENEDNIVRDLGFLRLKGYEELFKPLD